MNPSSPVTLRQMQALVQVARHGSFTQAAAALHLTQSATSALIKELEERLGLDLLDRTTRRVVLTRGGEEFLVRAERILADVAHAVADARDLVDLRRGQVTLAASPMSSSTFLPGIVAAFVAEHPHVRVDLHDILTDAIVDQVLSGAAELGIGTFQQSIEGVEFVTLFEHRIGVAMLAGSALAAKRAPTWADVAGEPRISLSRSSAFRPLVDNVLASLGAVVDRPRFEVGYMGTAVALVEAGLGVAVLPERATALARSSAVCWRPLVDPVVVYPSTLAKRAGRSLSPGARTFVDFLTRHLHDAAPAPRGRRTRQKRTAAPKSRAARNAE
ncbi:MAG: LysR family transcriptional regulator [Burkholderiales bacterium]|jgi:DNA-binding transcriptional LysR family regulator|nr:LysR family transcriptional regulator [Burkholderiales bacterium]